MIIFETDRLLLKTLKMEDIDSVMGFWGDAEVMKYCGGACTKERELRALKFYTNLQKGATQVARGKFLKHGG